MTRRELFQIFSGPLVLNGTSLSNLTTEWTGAMPAIAAKRPYGFNVGWIDGREVGFRSDGVVVWRIAQKEGE